jgi:antitoxin component of MazEF toxin-antitoxin module
MTGRKTWFCLITQTTATIGNSQGLMFDAALMNLSRLNAGDQVRVTLHDGQARLLLA